MCNYRNFSQEHVEYLTDIALPSLAKEPSLSSDERNQITAMIKHLLEDPNIKKVLNQDAGNPLDAAQPLDKAFIEKIKDLESVLDTELKVRVARQRTDNYEKKKRWNNNPQKKEDWDEDWEVLEYEEKKYQYPPEVKFEKNQPPFPKLNLDQLINQLSNSGPKYDKILERLEDRNSSQQEMITDFKDLIKAWVLHLQNKTVEQIEKKDQGTIISLIEKAANKDYGKLKIDETSRIILHFLNLCRIMEKELNPDSTTEKITEKLVTMEKDLGLQVYLHNLWRITSLELKQDSVLASLSDHQRAIKVVEKGSYDKRLEEVTKQLKNDKVSWVEKNKKEAATLLLVEAANKLQWNTADKIEGDWSNPLMYQALFDLTKELEKQELVDSALFEKQKKKGLLEKNMSFDQFKNQAQTKSVKKTASLDPSLISPQNLGAMVAKARTSRLQKMTKEMKRDESKGFLSHKIIWA